MTETNAYERHCTNQNRVMVRVGVTVISGFVLCISVPCCFCCLLHLPHVAFIPCYFYEIAYEVKSLPDRLLIQMLDDAVGDKSVAEQAAIALVLTPTYP